MLDLARGPLLVGVADRPAALGHAAALAAAARPFDLVEARLDLFPSPTLEGCAEACDELEASGTPVLVTLRTKAQGGRFTRGEADRLALFREALAHASWADVEDDAAIAVNVAELVAARPGGGQLVVSHHDFARTPPLPELLGIVDRCHAIPGAVAKVATAVKEPGDRQTLLDVLLRRANRTCVIGMDARGAASSFARPGSSREVRNPSEGSEEESSEALRIELGARGSLLVYGYLESATAPGQLSAADTHARLLAAAPAYAARKST